MVVLLRALLIFLMVATMHSTSLADDSKASNVAWQLVEKFCRSDFVGAEDTRLAFAKFSPEVLKKHRGPELPGVIGMMAEPVIVVRSYEVVGVKLENDRGVASVKFQRLARTEGEGLAEWKIIPEDSREETVQFNLVLSEGRWWVLDPPIPRVSKSALIKMHEDHIKFDDQRFTKYPELKEGLYLKQYLNFHDNLKILGQLQGD